VPAAVPPPRSPQHLALGEAIRRRRMKLGHSQEAVALDAGLDRTYYSGIERGEYNPAYAALLQIAEVLGVPLSDLQREAERAARKR
jgi:transcriptional regulator with XRE-family HTH domain